MHYKSDKLVLPWAVHPQPARQGSHPRWSRSLNNNIQVAMEWVIIIYAWRTWHWYWPWSRACTPLKKLKRHQKLTLMFSAYITRLLRGVPDKKVAYRILWAILENQIFGQKWPKLVSGPLWPKRYKLTLMAQSGKKTSLPILPSKFC